MNFRMDCCSCLENAVSCLCSLSWGKVRLLKVKGLFPIDLVHKI